MSKKLAKVTLGVANANWDGSMLRIDTGKASRSWCLTSRGLQTTSLRRTNGREWINTALPTEGCDWFIWGFHQRSSRAVLRETLISPVTGDPLGSDRIEALFVFDYLEVGLGLR